MTSIGLLREEIASLKARVAALEAKNSTETKAETKAETKKSAKKEKTTDILLETKEDEIVATDAE